MSGRERVPRVQRGRAARHPPAARRARETRSPVGRSLSPNGPSETCCLRPYAVRWPWRKPYSYGVRLSSPRNRLATQARPKREIRTPLSRERVLRAAIELADEGGIESLSMRRLAQDLGVEAMSLYYSFPRQ